MWRNLLDNLTKQQKIAIGVVTQLIIIVLLIFTVRMFLNKEEIRTYNTEESAEMEGVPKDLETTFRKQLWSVVSSQDKSLTESEFSYTVREGSYEKTTENGANAANFLVDVDAIKQTYKVSIMWSDEKNATPADILINCPRQEEMKYQDVICQGMYDNTNSLDVYLPYISYPEYGGELAAPNVYIEGDEHNKVIDILVSACDEGKYRQEAMDYLDSTPIDFSGYTINVEVNDIDVECE